MVTLNLLVKRYTFQKLNVSDFGLSLKGLKRRTQNLITTFKKLKDKLLSLLKVVGSSAQIGITPHRRVGLLERQVNRYIFIFLIIRLPCSGIAYGIRAWS